MREHYPDVSGDEDYAKLLNEAYEVLSNPDKRRHYDEYRQAYYDGLSTGSYQVSEKQTQSGFHFRRWILVVLTAIAITVLVAFSGVAKLEGEVVDAVSLVPIDDAIVNCGKSWVSTDANGNFNLGYRWRFGTMNVSAPGYEPVTVSRQTKEIKLSPTPQKVLEQIAQGFITADANMVLPHLSSSVLQKYSITWTIRGFTSVEENELRRLTSVPEESLSSLERQVKEKLLKEREAVERFNKLLRALHALLISKGWSLRDVRVMNVTRTGFDTAVATVELLFKGLRTGKELPLKVPVRLIREPAGMGCWKSTWPDEKFFTLHSFLGLDY
jgi:curved DNA-binding protein CbpA